MPEDPDDLLVTLDAPVDPLIGTTLDDRYLVVRPIGIGGMGIVYEARHVGLDKPLAVKVLRPDIASDEIAVERFRREAMSATMVGNPHILDIVDFGHLPSGESFFAMEFLDGSSLARTILRESPLPVPRVVHIAAQLAEALGDAHRAGVVHRDVKPDNVILVNRNGDPDFVKVLDFGIALVADAGAKLTRPGEVFGSPEYMSPEQCRGETIDAASDVYSFGVVLYEMIAGTRPIHGATFFELVEAHLVDVPIPLHSLRIDCTPHLEAVVMHCLEKDPHDRYANCGLVAEELRRIEAGYAPRGAVRRTPRFVARRRRRMLSSIAALVGLGLFAYAGYLAMNPPRGGWFAPAAARTESETDAPEDLASVPIRLESDPPGAEVFVNDELVGITPCHAPRPGPGRRFDLVFRRPGFEDRVVSVSSATIGRVLRYSLEPVPTRTTPRVAPDASLVVALPEPQTAPPPPPPPRRRDVVHEVVDPWE